MNKDMIYTVSLLSLLKEKGVVTTEEIRDVQTFTKMITLLFQKKVLTEDQFTSRTEDVQRILNICLDVLSKKPVTPDDMKMLRDYRTTFPKLVDFLLGGTHRADFLLN